jgi:diacylglycerol kinase family enzyme
MSRGERAGLVVNARASRVTPAAVEGVERILRTHFELETAVTASPLDAVEITAELGRDSSVAAVFAFAGDGGFNEVINGLPSDLPLGLIPGGRTNVLPRALGLGADPFVAARWLVSAVAAGRQRRIALGRANGRRFSFSCGFGLDAQLVRIWDRLERRRDGRKRGDIAFLAAAMRVLLERRGRVEPMLDVDGEHRAAFVVAAKTDPYSFLGRIPLHVSPTARFEDRMDVVAVRRVTPSAIPGLLALLLFNQSRWPHSEVTRRTDVAQIEITAMFPVAMHVDGEDLGDVTHLTLNSELDAIALIA